MPVAQLCWILAASVRDRYNVTAITGGLYDQLLFQTVLVTAMLLIILMRHSFRLKTIPVKLN